MRYSLVAALVLFAGCACGEETPRAEARVAPAELAQVVVEPRPCEVVFTPAAAIAELVESAAEQWREATGCDVHVGEGGIPVSFVDRILDANGNPQCGETHRVRDESGAILGADFIHISTNKADRCHLPARDVLHELGHGLAPHRGHAAEGLMAAAWNEVDYVDEVARAFVCQELGC